MAQQNKQGKPKYFFLIVIIAVTTIFAGIYQIFQSLPIYSLTNVLQTGILYSKSDRVHIEKVAPGSPAEKAGIIKGDYVLEMNGISIKTDDQVGIITRANKGNNISIVLSRNNSRLTTFAIPRIDYPPTEGPLGISITSYEPYKVNRVLAVPRLLISKAVWERNNEFIGVIGQMLGYDYFQIKYFLYGFINLILGIGLWKLAKWALYGTIFFQFILILETVIYFVGHTNDIWTNIYTPVCISLAILTNFFLYTQRKYFR